MEITDIRIKRVESDNKLKAYVTITFDNCFVVHNLKIIMGQFGRFVAMPSRKTRDGEFKDIAHPINSDFRRKIQARILEEFDKGAGELHISGQDDEESPAGQRFRGGRLPRWRPAARADIGPRCHGLPWPSFGTSASGKPPEFGSGIRRFESCRPRND